MLRKVSCWETWVVVFVDFENLSCFDQDPAMRHWKLPNQVMHWIAATMDYEIRFPRNSSLTLEDYGRGDSDWARDIYIHRSVTGLILLLKESALCEQI